MQQERFKELTLINGYDIVRSIVNRDAIARAEEREDGTARIYFASNSKHPFITEETFNSLRSWLLGRPGDEGTKD